jgi:hypothetical protein
VFNFPGYIRDASQNNRFHLTPVRMAIIKGNNNNKCGQGCDKQEHNTLLVGLQISTTTMESSMERPQKTKDRTAYDPVIPLLGIYPKECKSGYNRDTCTPMFIVALFIIAKF